MRRLKLTTLAVITLVSCSSYVYASETPIEYSPITLNTSSKTGVITYEGMPFYSVRLLNDSLAYKLSWDGKTKSVLLENDQTKISLTTNQTYFMMNDKRFDLTKPIILAHNTLYASEEFWKLAFNITPVLKGNMLTLVTATTSSQEPVTIPAEDPSSTDSTTNEDANTSSNLSEEQGTSTESTSSPEIEERILPLFEGTNTYNVGQKLIIRLEEHPSTGYKWEVNFPKGITVLEDFFTPSNIDLPSSSGEHTWIIRPTEVTSFTIEFNKLRTSDSSNIIDSKVFKLKTKSVVPQN